MKKIQVGDCIAGKTLMTVDSSRVPVPDAQRLVHLQFRRFAGCPFCSVHLRSFARRHDEIAAAGIREVIVFRSSPAALRHHYGDVPVAVVADPGGELYADFGVESALRALLHPRVLLLALLNVMRLLPRLPGLPFSGKVALGLPADFLIAPDGLIRACKYGAHADDQWSVDELLSLAHETTSPPVSRGKW